LVKVGSLDVPAIVACLNQVEGGAFGDPGAVIGAGRHGGELASLQCRRRRGGRGAGEEGGEDSEACGELHLGFFFCYVKTGGCVIFVLG